MSDMHGHRKANRVLRVLPWPGSRTETWRELATYGVMSGMSGQRFHDRGQEPVRRLQRQWKEKQFRHLLEMWCRGAKVIKEQGKTKHLFAGKPGRLGHLPCKRYECVVSALKP